MFKNYFTIAWRNIFRHPKYSIINVLGLTLGITCCLLIFLWVRDEKSVDNFPRNGNHLFVIYMTIVADGKTTGTYSTPSNVVDNRNHLYMEDVKRTVPEIRSLACYTTGYELPWGYPETLQSGDKLLKLNGARAGEDFFKIFGYPLVEGNAATALSDMHGIALSRRTAVALFGSPRAAMGRPVRFENKYTFNVSAVYEDLPKESSLQFDFLNNWEAQKRMLEWASGNVRIYVQLSPGADIAKVENELTQYLRTTMGPVPHSTFRLGLQRVSDQYLYNVFTNGRPLTGRIEYVRIFSGVAIFILLIACINFMNLATARSVRRAKEVGLRKVVGSSRGQLIRQFLGESLVFALLSLLLSLALVLLLLPAFNRLTGKTIGFPAADPLFWCSLAAVGLVTGLLAGSYPALYLSSLQPVRTLKGVVRHTTGSILFRKGLTVFQFVLSIFLVIATIVVTRQADFIDHTNLGYDRENLIYVRIDGELSKLQNYLLFKERLSPMPGIAMVDRSTEAPHSMTFDVSSDDIKWEGKPANANVPVEPASVGFDFVKLMHLTLVGGRDFSRQNATDSSDAFLVNEVAVKEMGFKDPIGKWVSAWAKRGHIIGVIRDYHTRSLRDPIRPLLLDVKEGEYFGVILIRTLPGRTKEALASIATVYKEVNPNFAFGWQFVDEEYQKMYISEMITSKLSVLFAVLAIAISSMGLLGLVLLAAEQRTREIGIRKVLGASIAGIVTLFSMDFLKLILIAFVIGGSLGWWAMHAWLNGFTYRIPLSWWIFVLAGAGVTLMAMVTIGYRALRSAAANPVEALRSE
jgi:putative ABC transport system permease protein